MFAVIETGGKQYKVNEGDVIRVEKLNEENGAVINFNVLAIGGESVKVGNPYVDGAKVEAAVMETGRGKKIYILKYKAKKNEKKKIGHRQSYTKVKITKIMG